MGPRTPRTHQPAPRRRHRPHLDRHSPDHTEPADHDRAEAATRAAYRAVGLPERRLFIWCPSPGAALDHIESFIDDGQASLVNARASRGVEPGAVRGPGPTDGPGERHRAIQRLGRIPLPLERMGFYGGQLYDGMDERYDLVERPYRCLRVLQSERSAPGPVLHTVPLPARPQPHVGGDRPFGHRPLRAPTGLLLGRGAGARRPGRRARAVSPLQHTRSERPALRPGLVLQPRPHGPDHHRHLPQPPRRRTRSCLAGMPGHDEHQRTLATRYQHRHDGRITSTAVMGERPILLTLNDRGGRLHSDAGPAIHGPPVITCGRVRALSFAPRVSGRRRARDDPRRSR
ncbi:hypothetical protein LAH08_03048 [Micromonospora noduli]|uniref:Uncharacterized protein n=1 Tax=Micromonospora noduli TaxID=709876 RepID=A0A328N9J7_9ACTN|nr:hypothetical protein LAH08_03048 [Micromonospora noduli]